jgi:hypothetical protein
MTPRTPRRRLSGFLLCTAILLAPSAGAFAQIMNGDHEGPTTKPWERLTSDMPAGCVRAQRVEQGNPGKCAKMGQNAKGDGLPGCNLTGIQQEFDCFIANPPGDWCTVSFDARYPAGAAGETPFVELANGLGSRTGEIPVNAAWTRYTISTPFCSRSCRISFAIESGGPPTMSTLWIDNVDDECTSTDMTSNELTIRQHALFGDATADLDDLTAKAVPIMPWWSLAALGALLACLGWTLLQPRGHRVRPTS